MDWTDTKHEAAGVDLSEKLERMSRENPRQFQAWAAGLGLLQGLFPGPNSSLTSIIASRHRNENPITYRLGAYGVPALLSYLAPPIGAPMLAVQAAGDPLVERFYHDNVEPPPPDEPTKANGGEILERHYGPEFMARLRELILKQYA